VAILGGQGSEQSSVGTLAHGMAGPVGKCPGEASRTTRGNAMSPKLGKKGAELSEKGRNKVLAELRN
jgi:hypothetical protein